MNGSPGRVPPEHLLSPVDRLRWKKTVLTPKRKGSDVATPEHIPAGNYPAHAAAHALDLEEAADRLLAKLPGHRRQTENLAKEAGVSVVLMAMEAGDAIAEHSAKGAVTVHLLRGHAVLTAGDQSFELRPGKLVLLQPEVRHDIRAEVQSVVMLTVSGGA